MSVHAVESLICSRTQHDANVDGVRQSQPSKFAMQLGRYEM